MVVLLSLPAQPPATVPHRDVRGHRTSHLKVSKPLAGKVNVAPLDAAFSQKTVIGGGVIAALLQSVQG